MHCLSTYSYCFANCGGGEGAGLIGYLAGSVFEQEGQDPKIPRLPRLRFR